MHIESNIFSCLLAFVVFVCSFLHDYCVLNVRKWINIDIIYEFVEIRTYLDICSVICLHAFLSSWLGIENVIIFLMSIFNQFYYIFSYNVYDFCF